MTITKRGGSRNLGMKMSNNGSGLNAIHFGRERGIAQVYVAFGSGRASYSVRANGPRLACERAIRKRLDAGMPAPTVGQALRALNRFLAS